MAMTSPGSARRRALVFRVIWIIWWLGLFLATHKPRLNPPRWGVPGLDKAAHFLLYFMLTLLGGMQLGASKRPLSRESVLRWMVIYGVFAIFDEWSQQFVQRDMSFWDWMADFVGIITASLILRRLTITHRKPTPSASDQ